jgi:hypothetical protein
MFNITPRSGTFLPGQSRMNLWGVHSSQLTEGDGEKSSDYEQTRSRHGYRRIFGRELGTIENGTRLVGFYRVEFPPDITTLLEKGNMRIAGYLSELWFLGGRAFLGKITPG